MEKRFIETIIDYETISPGRKRYVNGFILKGHCQIQRSGKEVSVNLKGEYGNKDYNQGYLTVCEEIACPSYYSNFIFREFVAFFKPKKEKEEIASRFKKGLERVLDEISNLQGDLKDYIYLSSREYLNCSDILYLKGIFDLYTESTGDFLRFFKKDSSKEGKKAILEFIYSCDFENPKVIEFLEQNEQDLLKEVAFY